MGQKAGANFLGSHYKVFPFRTASLLLSFGASLYENFGKYFPEQTSLRVYGINNIIVVLPKFQMTAKITFKLIYGIY